MMKAKIFKYTLLFSILATTSCSVPPKITPEQAAGHISVTLSMPDPLPGGEVLLHPTREPIPLNASIENLAPGKLFLSLLDEKIEWSAPEGSFSEIFQSATAWTPPALSATVPITVTYTCRLKEPDTTFTRPEPITITTTATLTVITATPGRFLSGGYLDGCHIGEYPDPHAPEYRATATLPRKHPEAYRPPEAFYKVTKANFDARLTAHIQLGDYTLHYPWFTLGIPQYIAIDPNLFRKVEDLITLMQRSGHPNAHMIRVIYPFRPPSYNLGMIAEDKDESLKVPFSMHQYGKAIDMIIDADGDLVLDDLNGDGRSDVHDALVIAHFVNILDRQYRDAGDARMGGAGVYTHHDFHERAPSPYIHIDVRNYTNDQGQLIRWPARLDDGTVIEWGKI